MVRRSVLYLYLVSLTSLHLPAQDRGQDLRRALTGTWTGILEYRDYSEAAASTKRVKLPTWLTVEPIGKELRFRYVYDDGPGKTVTESSTIAVDSTAMTYRVTGADGKFVEDYKVSGLEQLKQGRGTLVLSGVGQENNAPVEVRTTFRVGRNLLEVTRETGPKSGSLSFRHAYTLVRSAPPE